jgi:hypothetical protein
MLTCAQVAAFPFIQRACAAPMHPASVLSFFFGTNLFDDDQQQHARQHMWDGKPLWQAPLHDE